MKIKNAPNLKKVWKAYRTGHTSSLNAVEKKTLLGIKKRIKGGSKKVSPRYPPSKKNPKSVYSYAKKLTKQGKSFSAVVNALRKKYPDYLNPETIAKMAKMNTNKAMRVNPDVLVRASAPLMIDGERVNVSDLRPQTIMHDIGGQRSVITSIEPTGVRDLFEIHTEMLKKNPKFYTSAWSKRFPSRAREKKFNVLVHEAIKLLDNADINEVEDYFIAQGYTPVTANKVVVTAYNYKTTPLTNPYDQYGRFYQGYFTDPSGIVRPLAGKAVKRKLHKETHAIPLRRYIKPNPKKKTKKKKAIKKKVKKKVEKKVIVRIGRKVYRATKAEVRKLIKAGYRVAKKNPCFVGGKGKMTAIEYKGTDNAFYRHDFKKPRQFEVKSGALVAVPVTHTKERGLLG